jgi:hypothetical protein
VCLLLLASLGVACMSSVAASTPETRLGDARGEDGYAARSEQADAVLTRIMPAQRRDSDASPRSVKLRLSLLALIASLVGAPALLRRRAQKDGFGPARTHWRSTAFANRSPPGLQLFPIV